MRPPALAAAALLFLSAPALAQSSKEVLDQAKTGAQGMGPIEGKPLPKRQVAKYSHGPFPKEVLKNSADWLRNEPKTRQFVNESGCDRDEQGQKVELTADAWETIIKDVSDPKNTEVVFISAQDMSLLTGNPQAAFFGVTKELKKRFNTERAMTIGDLKKNAIALRAPAKPNDPNDLQVPGPNDHAADSGIMAVSLAHELLHIAYRQLKNEDFGGGGRKTDTAPEISNIHHRLTDHLGWKPVQRNQSDAPWNPQGGNNCPKPPSSAAQPGKK